jgi:FkbM family methyltransferase
MRFKFIRNCFRKIGIDISPYPNGTLLRKIELLKLHNIDLILDVGASDGGFAQKVRSAGYCNEIISFEPISDSFKKLEQKIKKDKNWTAFNFALGATNEELKINISQNYDSSSFLDMTENHLSANPESKYKSTEKVIVKKLDSIFKGNFSEYKSIFLKLDVQGYENEVLIGASEALKNIEGIQIEMSFEELYEGSILFDEMKQIIENHGFNLCLLESGNRNRKTGKLLQADAVFFRL